MNQNSLIKKKLPALVCLMIALTLPLSGCKGGLNNYSGPLTTVTVPTSSVSTSSVPSPDTSDPSVSSTETSKTPSLPTEPSTEPSTTVPPSSDTPVPDPEDIVEILAVGDNLFHSQLITAGEALGYDRLYDGIRDTVSAADLAILNQETVFTTGTPHSYPKFATPTAVGDATIKAGFDVFTCATNHTWDWGTQGVLDTMEYWAAHPEVLAIGLNESKSARNELDIVEVKGIRIALFNFGTSINTKADAWWMANYLDTSESTRNWIAGQITKAKNQADFVIVCAHWGDEYVYTPTEKEIYWAQFFADCGVDLVIGTHPHVVQPVMEVEGKDGNTTLVYYSLGNFISAQNDLNTNVGGLARVYLTKDDTGTRIVSYELVATTVDCQVIDGVECYMPRLLSDMTDDMFQSGWKFSDYTVADFRAIFEEAIVSYPKNDSDGDE
ncbi:MAG: CapA family protein [Eubacteriales bacterium]